MSTEPSTNDQLPAFERLKVPGPEHELLRPMVGTFTVRNQLWPMPDAEPIVSTGVARRRMIQDLYLEEVMEPGPGSQDPPFTRISYLDFNYVNRRWEYVSLDTRIPAYLMYETSVDDVVEGGDTIVVHLPGFTWPGWGPELTGQTIRQRREIDVDSATHHVMRQYWTLPDAQPYLAVEYVYERRP